MSRGLFICAARLLIRRLHSLMSVFSLHPATRLSLWLALLIIVQCLNGRVLAFALPVALTLLVVSNRRIPARGLHLIWRARWLLLSLFVILAWGIAGDPLWDGAWAPTREGLSEALTHLGRLLLVLMIVAALLETLPLPDLLAASRSLMVPLRRFGFDADRGVIRLMLVLRYVESLPRPRDWRSLLAAPTAVASERVEVIAHPVRGVDYAAGLVAFVALVLACFNRGA